MERLSRLKLLAAEISSYSYADYADHVGNARFDSIMPRKAATLQRAAKERWPIRKVAASLEVEPEEAEDLLAACHRTVHIIEATNPAEAFRNGVRQSVEFALREGLEGSEAIEKLVTQVCYRAADLAYLLDLEGSRLSRYSRHLRREPGQQYYEGYFDESDED